MKRLGVNIDHVATLRNARGERHPDPYYAALQVVKMGADSITIHLREDRRHINDLDAKKICKAKKVLVNLEISMNDKIVENALKIKPNYVCLVPENRKEITTEGGLDLVKHKKKLKDIIEKFKLDGPISYFLEEFVEKHFKYEKFIKRKRDKKDKTDLVVEGKGDSRIRQKSDVFRAPRKKN